MYTILLKNEKNLEIKTLQLNHIPQIGTTIMIKKDEVYKIKNIEYNVFAHHHCLEVEKL